VTIVSKIFRVTPDAPWIVLGAKNWGVVGRGGAENVLFGGWGEKGVRGCRAS